MRDVLVTLITVVLGPGGIALYLVSQKKTGLTSAQVEKVETVAQLQQTDIGQRWKAYADDIETRLSGVIEQQQDQLTAQQGQIAELTRDRDIYKRREGHWVTYTGDLRGQVVELGGTPKAYPGPLVHVVEQALD